MPSNEVEGEGLALQYCSNVNGADSLRGLTAFAVFPERNLLFCGLKGCVAVLDAVTCGRRSTITLPKAPGASPSEDTPSHLSLLPGNKLLVVICKEWRVYVHSLESSKTTMILNLGDVKRSQLVDPICAVLTIDSRPVIFVAARGKDSLRSVHLGVKGDKAKELLAGSKVLLDKGNGIAAVAVHTNGNSFVTLTRNGELQGYRYELPSVLVPTFQFSMLIEGKDTKEPSPLVVNATLMTAPHPFRAGVSLIFIALPRQGTLYVMEQPENSNIVASPVEQIIWRDIDAYLTLEVHPVSKLLIGIAGRIGGRYRMRAWDMVGHSSSSELQFVERTCSQHVSQLEVAPDASSVFSQPDWAKLWEGEPSWTAAASQTEFLDLTSLPMKAAGLEGQPCVPVKAHLFGASSLVVVRYQAQGLRGQVVGQIGVFRVLDQTHPTLAHPSGCVAAFHAAPFDWVSVDDDGDKVQLFPWAAYYLKDNSIMAHMTATESDKVAADVPASDASGRVITPDIVLYSKRTHAWLVFCRVLQDPRVRLFTHICPGGVSAVEHEQVPPWFGAGIMGAYLGSTDERFAVLEAGEVGVDNIAIYNTREMVAAHPPLGRTYCELGMGDCLKSLWPGPPCNFALEEPVYDANGALVEQEEVLGAGMVLLVTKLGSLMLALLPLPDVASHADLQPEENVELPPLVPQCALKLMPGERLLQVVWNTFVDALSVGYPSHCLGAVLSTQRVMIVSGNLMMLQTVPIADPLLGSVHSVNSMLWVGPALLLSHAGGRVEQLLFNGKRTHVCSLAMNGTAVLAGALGDRLLFAQQRQGAWAMAVRRVGVASLVMQAWASLLATEHVSAPWNVVRLHMQSILANYNISSCSDAALIEGLITAGCGDIAMRCIDDFTQAVGISKVAHAAASGSWDVASKHVLQEYERSAYYPCAPPPNSAFRNTLIMVALGAMSQGKWSCVDRCVRAAGESLLLMLLHALQHDRAALQASVDAQSTSKPLHTLAMLLLAADSRIGLRVTVQKDWQIHRHQSDTDVSTWTCAEELYPKMRAKAPMAVGPSLIAPGEEGPIPPMDVGGLAAHLGLTHAEILESAKVVGLAPSSRMSDVKAMSPIREADSELPVSSLADDEQERARRDFIAGFEGDSLFGDDEEEGKDGEGGLIALDDGDDASSSRPAPKFRIQIKDTSFAAGPTGADVANAAKNIAIGGGMSMAALKKKAAPEPEATDPWADLGMPAPKREEEGEAAATDADPFSAFDDLAISSPVRSQQLPDAAPSAPLSSASSMPPVPAPAAPPPPPQPAISGSDLDDLFGPAQPPAPPPASSAAPAPPASVSAPGLVAPAASAVSATTAQRSVSSALSSRAGSLPPPPGPPLPQPPGAPVGAAMDASALPGFAAGVGAMLQGQWVAAEAGFRQAFAAAAPPQRRQVAHYLTAIYILATYGMSDELAARMSRYAACLPALQFGHVVFLTNDAVRRNMAHGNFAWARAVLAGFVQRAAQEGRTDIIQSATEMMRTIMASGTTDRSVPPGENIPAFVAAIDAAASADEVKACLSRLFSGA